MIAVQRGSLNENDPNTNSILAATVSAAGPQQLHITISASVTYQINHEYDKCSLKSSATRFCSVTIGHFLSINT